MAKRKYSLRNVGRKGVAKVDQPYVVKGGKKSFGSGGSRYTYAGASTLAYSKVPRRRIRQIEYRQAVSRTPSGAYISGTGVFVNLGKGLQGRGLRGWGGLIGVKGQTHLGIRVKAPAHRGRHRA